MNNMGRLDRLLRLVVVAAIAAAWFMGLLSGTLAIVLGIGAVAFALTSLFGTCPLYLPFGLSTRGKS
ncbi:DUF2892 domain-containing protein [Sphingopyxis sp.]|uniref:YgaP family membrane protein n=1 Tax=Sphingopyxis sp. TaxID=1908224 RepID=UPI001D49F2A5|nr:DUF2892 domain-containing protein [Sphingopyxis sp.]MBW8294458.1 DUF2892 domain-containing protein [Sphingopyxis sp.]